MRFQVFELCGCGPIMPHGHGEGENAARAGAVENWTSE
jgi:hypothetical protein